MSVLTNSTDTLCRYCLWVRASILCLWTTKMTTLGFFIMIKFGRDYMTKCGQKVTTRFGSDEKTKFGCRTKFSQCSCLKKESSTLHSQTILTRAVSHPSPVSKTLHTFFYITLTSCTTWLLCWLAKQHRDSVIVTSLPVPVSPFIITAPQLSG